MASRYSNATILTNSSTGKKYMSTTIYPKIKPADEDMYIISDSGDRLDILALKYYGDPTLWWIISIANNLNEASFSLEAGKQLRIPSNVSKILNDLDKINK